MIKEIFAVVGACLIVGGIALIYVPAALIVAGAIFILCAYAMYDAAKDAE